MVELLNVQMPVICRPTPIKSAADAKHTNANKRVYSTKSCPLLSRQKDLNPHNPDRTAFLPGREEERGSSNRPAARTNILTGRCCIGV